MEPPDTSKWPRRLVVLRLNAPLILVVDHHYPEADEGFFRYVWEERECFAPNITGQVEAAMTLAGDPDPHGVCEVIAVVPPLPNQGEAPLDADEVFEHVRRHAPGVLP